MKAKLFSAVLSVVMVLGLAFVSCYTIPKSEVDLEGTWMLEVDGFIRSYTFTGSNFTYTYEIPASSISSSYSGTFTFTDTTITFYGAATNEMGAQIYTRDYTLRRKYFLHFALDPVRSETFTFTKRPVSRR